VCNNLRHLKQNKAPGPDGLPNWIFKEYAEILCEPLANILNSSFREQRLPSVWKHANVIPIPKVKQVKYPKKEIRSISLAPSISKIAEEFVVTDYIKPAILKNLDPNQYGTVPGSSTVTALINMVHKWLYETDGTGSVVRVLLFDYRKPFDLIDHTILVNKLKELDISTTIINWIKSFLSNRLQRVKLSHDCMSEWGVVPSGVPQGTNLMTSNLGFPDDPFDIWKYVDDSTVSEIIIRGHDSNAQIAVDKVVNWSKESLLQLNGEKCKELTISFGRNRQPYPPVIIDGIPMEKVSKAKLLGVTINNKLSWNDHIEEVIKKAARRLYFLVQLKRANVPVEDIVAYYSSCIRTTLDYACPLFHNSLTKYLQQELEKIQKRALAIVLPECTYQEALEKTKLETISERHEILSMNLFEQISKDRSSKLHSLLPQYNTNTNYNLRKKRTFEIPLVKTKRFANSFIMACSRNHDRKIIK
jgi:hypothetical protein